MATQIHCFFDVIGCPPQLKPHKVHVFFMATPSCEVKVLCHIPITTSQADIPSLEHRHWITSVLHNAFSARTPKSQTECMLSTAVLLAFGLTPIVTASVLGDSSISVSEASVAVASIYGHVHKHIYTSTSMSTSTSTSTSVNVPIELPSDPDISTLILDERDPQKAMDKWLKETEKQLEVNGGFMKKSRYVPPIKVKLTSRDVSTAPTLASIEKELVMNEKLMKRCSMYVVPEVKVPEVPVMEVPKARRYQTHVAPVTTENAVRGIACGSATKSLMDIMIATMYASKLNKK